MKLFSHAIAYAKKKGVKPAFQKAIKRIVGVEKHDEQIDTLYYFLNHFVDITQLPPTKDEGLRNVQIADSLLLGIFDKICQKHSINYWVDFGTLLGLVRHRGFIPWDDDMDVSMTREDYFRFINSTLSDFQKYGIEIIEYPGCLGLGYMHSETGIWLDVFPRDKYGINEDLNDACKLLEKKMIRYKKKYGIPKTVIKPEVLASRRRKLIGEEDGKNHLLYFSLEFYIPRCVYHDERWIFPLKRGLFEGVEVNVPNNIEASLIQIYGKNYMSFPRGGVEHHDQGRGPFGTWASKSNTDMNVVISSLKSIYNSFEE